jgi:hypothetical protein
LGPRAVRAAKEGPEDQVDGLCRWGDWISRWVDAGWMIGGHALLGRDGLLPGVPLGLEVLDVFGKGLEEAEILPLGRPAGVLHELELGHVHGSGLVGHSGCLVGCCSLRRDGWVVEGDCGGVKGSSP